MIILYFIDELVSEIVDYLNTAMSCLHLLSVEVVWLDWAGRLVLVNQLIQDIINL